MRSFLSQILPLLPAVNAVLVSASGLSVLLGIWYIRRGRRQRHMWAMIAATTLAGLFLVFYLLRIGLQGMTAFRGPQWARYLYLTVLFSHIGLAVFNLPLVITTIYRAVRLRWAAHRRIARITYPIWLYVSATGVLVYVLLHRIW